MKFLKPHHVKTIEFLRRRASTATEVGEMLYPEYVKSNRQSLARPAGNVLNTLCKLGIAKRRYDHDGHRFLWTFTERRKGDRRGGERT